MPEASELEESRKKISKLEKEKQDLSEKTKGLADIIESLSSDKDTSELEGMIGNKLKEMAEQMDLKVKRIEESSGSKDMEVKKQVVSLMKDKVDPKLGEISDKLKDLEKVKELGDKITQINDRLSSPLYQPKQPGAVSQGLASFGEQIDFESELNDVRKTIDTIKMSLANMSKKVEYRLSSAEDKLKDLEKLKGLETQYREINDKLGLENIEKLKKLVFTADELMEQVIPETVSRKMRVRVEPIVNSLKANRDFSNELEKKLSLLDGEGRELKKFRDTIQELRMEKEMMAELVEGRLQGMEKHLMILDEKARALSEKDRDILGQVEEMEAPENLRKWIADKTKDMERKFYYDVQGFKKESEKNVET